MFKFAHGVVMHVQIDGMGRVPNGAHMTKSLIIQAVEILPRTKIREPTVLTAKVD